MSDISTKLTYLNGTKTKIREGLNSLGADLTTEDTFRSYADAIENIYEDYPKITGEGESLTLDNTKQARLSTTLKGNTSQNGTPTPSSPIPVNIVSGDNTIDICGNNLFDGELELGNINNTTGQEASSTTTIRTKNYIPVEPNTTYVISNNLTGAVYEYNASKGFIKTDYTPSSVIYTTITTTATTKYIRWKYTSTDTTLKYMMIKETTPQDYEPYIGNTYPIYLGVENLFDGEIEYGSINPTNGNLVDNNYRTRSKNFIKVNPNTTYTITRSNNNSYFWIVGYNSNKQGITDGLQDNPSGIAQTPTSTTATLTFTTTATTEYIKWYQTNADGGLNEDILIILGDKPNHTSTQPIELCKIGTYQDYIYKENKKWYLYKEIGKVVLDGSENWLNAGSVSGTDNWNYRLTNALPFIKLDSNSNAYCNLYPLTTINNSNTNQGIYYNGSTFLAVRWGIEGTIENYKNWLSSHNIILYGILANPTVTEITDTSLISQLNALRNAESYAGQTNISQTNADLPFILDVKALRGE